MVLFKDEGEERQSLASGLERILIKGRCFDQTEKAWNHFYLSGFQAVSLPALNFTLINYETYSSGVLTGSMTPPPATHFAGNELHKICIGSNWALDYSVLLSSTSKPHKALLPARMHVQPTLCNSKLACVAEFRYILVSVWSCQTLVFGWTTNTWQITSTTLPSSFTQAAHNFHLHSGPAWNGEEAVTEVKWHVDSLWNSNSDESGLTKLNRGGNPCTVDSINYIKKEASNNF